MVSTTHRILKYIYGYINNILVAQTMHIIETMERVSISKERAGRQYMDFMCSEFSTRGLVV